MRRGLFLAAVALGVSLLGAPAAQAHPLGNFTVNEYSAIVVARDAVKVHFVLDMAEIPTFQERQGMDANADGSVSDTERTAYFGRQESKLLRGLVLKIDGKVAPMHTVARSLTFPRGQGGLPTLRLVLDLEAPARVGSAAVALDYVVNDFAERVGWREIVASGDDGVTLRKSSVPSQGTSNELRTYPQDMLASPLDVRSAHLTAVAATSVSPVVSTASDGATVSASARVPDGFANLIAYDKPTPAVFVAALLLALVLGAGHALTPGHGKTIVAAYLVGTRGTARHAVILGLTTTITHTASVFLLGFITLSISGAVVPERLFPWLELGSGLLVVGIGGTLLAGRIRLARDSALRTASVPEAAHTHDHPHGQEHSHSGATGHTHTHMPPGTDGQAVTWRSLLALGVSGGMLPCPTALVVLLGAIALHRVAFGMMLILAFSVGLAAVLTGIGLLLVYTRTWFDRFPTKGRLVLWLPVTSAVFVTGAGLFITGSALLKVGVFHA